MTTARTRNGYQPLCYKHQVEMNANQTLRTTEKVPTQLITFACPRPDCSVHYNSSKGYFMLALNAIRNWGEPEPGPLVRCERDRAPMYLSEFIPDRWALRLWKCPLCKTVRPNAEFSATGAPGFAQ